MKLAINDLNRTANKILDQHLNEQQIKTLETLEQQTLEQI